MDFHNVSGNGMNHGPQHSLWWQYRPQISIWLSPAAQTMDINMGQGHQYGSRRQPSSWTSTGSSIGHKHLHGPGGNMQPSLTPVTAVESLVWPLSTTHAPLFSMAPSSPYLLVVVALETTRCHTVLFSCPNSFTCK